MDNSTITRIRAEIGAVYERAVMLAEKVESDLPYSERVKYEVELVNILQVIKKLKY